MHHAEARGAVGGEKGLADGGHSLCKGPGVSRVHCPPGAERPVWPERASEGAWDPWEGQAEAYTEATAGKWDIPSSARKSPCSALSTRISG